MQISKSAGEAAQDVISLVAAGIINGDSIAARIQRACADQQLETLDELSNAIAKIKLSAASGKSVSLIKAIIEARAKAVKEQVQAPPSQLG